MNYDCFKWGVVNGGYAAVNRLLLLSNAALKLAFQFMLATVFATSYSRCCVRYNVDGTGRHLQYFRKMCLCFVFPETHTIGCVSKGMPMPHFFFYPGMLNSTSPLETFPGWFRLVTTIPSVPVAAGVPPSFLDSVYVSVFFFNLREGVVRSRFPHN